MKSNLFEILLFYISSYVIAYILLKSTQMMIQKYNSIQIEKDVWIRYYCVLVVIIIHFIWIHCHFSSNLSFKICFNSYHSHPQSSLFIFPLLFLTPIYIIFFYHFSWIRLKTDQKDRDFPLESRHYNESQWTESSSQENKKINRILNRIMILFFLVTIVFFFLSQRYQKKTMDLVTVLSVFEIF